VASSNWELAVTSLLLARGKLPDEHAMSLYSSINLLWPHHVRICKRTSSLVGTTCPAHVLGHGFNSGTNIMKHHRSPNELGQPHRQYDGSMVLDSSLTCQPMLHEMRP
jgi:hypothetical protein